jgi:dihydrofolate reductase
MKHVKYFVAASLDGYIAGSDGGVDWLFGDQDYGFADFLESVDTVLIGRSTYDFMLQHGYPAYEDKQNFVFSATLPPENHPLVTVVSDDAAAFVRSLKDAGGRDIWLVGGGRLFRALLEAGLVDEMIVALHPRLLGRGIPLLPETRFSTGLELTDVLRYETGLVTLSYRVAPTSRP